MDKRNQIKQILIDTIYTLDAKPRFINDNWVNTNNGSHLKRIDEAVDKIMGSFEPTPEDKANGVLCSDNEYPLKDMIELIQDQATVDGSTMIDYVEGVTVWEKMQLEFTCDEFLKHIGLNK